MGRRSQGRQDAALIHPEILNPPFGVTDAARQPCFLEREPMSRSTFFAGLLSLSLLAFADAPNAQAANIFGFGNAETVSAAVRSHCRHAACRSITPRSHHARLSRARGHAVSGRPRAWCGWYALRMFGLHDRSLWVARNWAHVGRPSGPHPGVAVVWAHHVGKVTAVAGNKIKVLSGNDGHRVRNRWRSMRGVIAFRRL